MKAPIGAREVTRKLAARLNKIATRPARSAYLWDEYTSPVALVVFHTVTMLRWLSLLQWVKWAYRHYLGKDHPYQKRTNFHSRFTELYFIAVILVLVMCGHLKPGLAQWWSAVQWLALYVAAEAVLWTCYYLFFRHFIEKNFTIYHHAEYFLSFPLALAVQVMGLAIFLGQDSSMELLAWIFNLNFSSSDTAWKTGLALLGVFYVVILLANLRDAFPKTVVKPITSIAIIGAGDVVRERLVPALTQPRKGHGAPHDLNRTPAVEINPSALYIYDIAASAVPGQGVELKVPLPNSRTKRTIVPVKIETHGHDIVSEITAHQTPTIIATPPDSHFYYLSRLNLQGIRFAVEKPISVFEPEIRTLLSGVGDALFSQGFAMSYYALEKALPLTYLYRMNPIHRDYLDISILRDEVQDCSSLPWNEVMKDAGTPKRITVLLLEGVERSPSDTTANRQWTESPFLGGLFYETAIHAITVLQKVLGQLGGMSELEVQSYRSTKAGGNSGCTFSRIRGVANHPASQARTEFDLVVGKYIPAFLKGRGVLVEYEALSVVCDFDSMHLQVQMNAATAEIQTVDIQVRKEFRDTRYAVQASLIRTFFEYGWRGDRYDDFHDQRQVLQWLVDQRRTLDASQVGMKTYGLDGGGLPDDLEQIVERYRKLRPGPRHAF